MVSGRVYDRDIPKQLGKMIEIDLCTLFLQGIGHVQCHDHRDIQLEQLHGEIQVPFQVGCIHHIDHDIRAFFADAVPTI